MLGIVSKNVACRGIKYCHYRTAVSAALVKELRDKSGAPMMDCKKALSDPSVNEDINKALDWLRKKGISKATNSSGDRVVSEGLIGVYRDINTNKMTLVEVNSETDFVSRNQDFQHFVTNLVTSIHHNHTQTGDINISDVLTTQMTSLESSGGSSNEKKSITVQEGLGDIVSKIRENIIIKRAYTLSSPPSPSTTTTSTILGEYVHGRVGLDTCPPHIQLGRSVAIVKLQLLAAAAAAAAADSDSALSDTVSTELYTVAKRLGMHVVASTPHYIQKSDIPADVVQREQDIFYTQSVEENDKSPKKKTSEQLQKIVQGRVDKRLSELCLLTQLHVAEEGNPIIQKYLVSLQEKYKITVTVDQFIKWTVGETTTTTTTTTTS